MKAKKKTICGHYLIYSPRYDGTFCHVCNTWVAKPKVKGYPRKPYPKNVARYGPSWFILYYGGGIEQ